MSSAFTNIQLETRQNSMSLKEKIIHESLRLFSLKGFLGTSLQDILAATGTSKGGFYNHFRSKEDLFYSVLDEARRTWRAKNLAGLDDIDESLNEGREKLDSDNAKLSEAKENLKKEQGEGR